MYFTPAFFRFLRDLKAHNDREWFADNKPQYVEHVETPMLAFIRDFAPRLRSISVAYVADPRKMGGSMFRIHRDTRFSPDKSPYKTWIAARFAHESRRKNPNVPAFYLHLGIDENFAGGGVYHVDRPELTRIRQRIVDDPRAWTKARQGIDVQGEQLKRAPAGFRPDHEHIEDLKRQNIYAMTTLTQAVVTGPDFLDHFSDVCASIAPMIEFQTKALGLRW